MSTPTITCYLKTSCGWSRGVRAMLEKYGLEFEEKDIIKNPAFRWEMEQKSGQSLSPCVVVNGTMLSDVSGDEVEAWMVENGVVEQSEQEADEPTRFVLLGIGDLECGLGDRIGVSPHLRRSCTARAKSARTCSVDSQEMQASVTDWP